MIRIAKLTDYAIVLLTYFTGGERAPVRNARDLAAATQLPMPTVSKLLKSLSRAGLLTSHRGVKGGYSLSRPAREIAVSDIIGAIEGPIALTECSSDTLGQCDIEPVCPVRANWRRINRAVVEALSRLTLDEMIRPTDSQRSAQPGELPGGHKLTLLKH